MAGIAMLDLLVLGVAIGCTYAVATQVLIPILLGRPVFPALRSRHQLEQDIAETRERLREVRLRQELDDLKRTVDKETMPPEIYDIVHRADEGGRVH